MQYFGAKFSQNSNKFLNSSKKTASELTDSIVNKNIKLESLLNHNNQNDNQRNKKSESQTLLISHANNA